MFKPGKKPKNTSKFDNFFSVTKNVFEVFYEAKWNFRVFKKYFWKNLNFEHDSTNLDTYFWLSCDHKQTIITDQVLRCVQCTKTWVQISALFNTFQGHFWIWVKELFSTATLNLITSYWDCYSISKVLIRLCAGFMHESSQ